MTAPATSSIVLPAKPRIMVISLRRIGDVSREAEDINAASPQLVGKGVQALG